MKKQWILGLLTALVTALAACSSDDNKDMTPPTITDKGIVASPIQCDVYHPGDVVALRYLFEDDTELGSFAVEVHGNFDHHSHSTEADEHEGAECEDDDHDHEAEADGTPWIVNETFPIPSGQRSYQTRQDFVVPDGVKPGDYHFMIRVTDLAGWQQLKSIAIRIEQ